MDSLPQPEKNSAPPPEKPQHPWAKRLGPLAPLALLLAKAKTLLLALFKLKFLFSFVAFLGVYWALYGAWFGIGFAVHDPAPRDGAFRRGQASRTSRRNAGFSSRRRSLRQMAGAGQSRPRCVP